MYMDTHIRQIQVQGMRRKREIKKDYIWSFVYLNLIDSVLLNSRIEHVMTMKGRTMSKMVYVRECPLYSVFWNVSIKCYILCTPLYYTLLRTPVRKCDVRSRNVVDEYWLVSLQIQKKYKIPCVQVICYFSTQIILFNLSKQNLVTFDVSTFVA